MKFTIIVDSREQTPLPISLPTLRRKLGTGDYSIRGLEHRVAFERKDRSDFIACIRGGRSRFESQLERLCRYQYRAVLIEANYSDFDIKSWHGNATPEAVKNSIAAWSLWGVPLIFCGSARGAATHLERAFTSIARLVVRENKHLVIEGEELCTR